jgi:hypothetical protein
MYGVYAKRSTADSSGHSEHAGWVAREEPIGRTEYNQTLASFAGVSVALHPRYH